MVIHIFEITRALAALLKRMAALGSYLSLEPVTKNWIREDKATHSLVALVRPRKLSLRQRQIKADHYIERLSDRQASDFIELK